MDTKRCLGVLWSILLTFDTWKLQNLCLSQNALLRGTKVVKQPFLSTRPKMIYGRVSEHFTSLRHVKDEKLVCSGWMHYFGVPKLWSIRSTPLEPKCCLVLFHCILLTFCKLKDVKLVCKPACTISRYQSCESSVLLHWTENYVWEYFVAFCLP
jgi:hypothetical protein